MARREQNAARGRQDRRDRKPEESAGVPANTRGCARKKANRERLTFMYWWRRRELNPRPQYLDHRIYMHSLSFLFNRPKL